jgi:hypothetical protein
MSPSLLFKPKSNLTQLKKIIKDYKKLYAEVGIENLIVKAFRLEKPVTGIEIYGKPVKKVKELKKELGKFFYVVIAPDSEIKNGKFYGELIVTRFRTLARLASRVALRDDVADLAGLMYGYKPKAIAQYIKKRGL